MRIIYTILITVLMWQLIISFNDNNRMFIINDNNRMFIIKEELKEAISIKLKILKDL